MAVPAAAVGAATDEGEGAGRKRGREGEERIADRGGKRCRTGAGGRTVIGEGGCRAGRERRGGEGTDDVLLCIERQFVLFTIAALRARLRVGRYNG